MKQIRLEIKGIDRTSDDNIVNDVSCFDMVNLEYRDGCYRPIRLDAIGKIKNSEGEDIDITDYKYIWLHYMSTNRIKWLGMKNVDEEDNGDLYYLFETGKIDSSKKETDTYCVEADGFEEYLIKESVFYKQVCFVGNLLVINTSTYNGLKDYKTSLDKSAINLNVTFTRKDCGYAYVRGRNAIKSADDTEKYDRSDVFETVKGLWNTLTTGSRKKGYFQGYTWLRYAIKLFDGSYINISSPVLMCSGVNGTRHSRYIKDNYNEPIIGEINNLALYTKNSNGEVVELTDTTGAIVRVDLLMSLSKLTVRFPRIAGSTGKVFNELKYNSGIEVQYEYDGDSTISFTLRLYKIDNSSGIYKIEDYDNNPDSVKVYQNVQYTNVDTNRLTYKYNEKPMMSMRASVWCQGEDEDKKFATLNKSGSFSDMFRFTTPWWYTDNLVVPNLYSAPVIDWIVGNMRFLKSGTTNFYTPWTDDDKVPMFATEGEWHKADADIDNRFHYNNDASDVVTNENFHNRLGVPDIITAVISHVWENAIGYANFGQSTFQSVALQKLSHIDIRIDSNITADMKDFIQSVDIFMTNPVSIYKNGDETDKIDGERIPLHPAGKSDKQLEEEILNSLHTFYKVASVDFEKVANGTYKTSPLDILEDFDLETLVTEAEPLVDNSEIVETNRMNIQYSNNSMIHSAGIKGRLNNMVIPFHTQLTEDYHNVFPSLASINPISQQADDKTDTSFTYLYNSETKKRFDSQVNTNRVLIGTDKNYDPGVPNPILRMDSLDALAEEGMCGVICLSARGTETESASYIGSDGIMKYNVKLKSSSVSNIKLFYKPYFLGYISNERDCKPDTESWVVKEDDSYIEYGNNILKVSQVNQPSFYPDAQTYTIGHGDIVGLCSNAIEVYQGEGNNYPVYVFTTEGVFGLRQGTEVAYSRVDGLSKEVCINGNTICQTDYGVVFATSNGLCIISGRVVKNISLKLVGSTFDYGSDAGNHFPQLLDSMEYVGLADEMSLNANRMSGNYDGEFLSYTKDKDTYCVFNTRKQLLIVYNTGDDTGKDYAFNSFMYLVDLKSGVFVKTTSRIQNYIIDYPEGFFCRKSFDKFIGTDINVGVDTSEGGIVGSTIFKLGDTNFSGNDIFKRFGRSDTTGHDLAVHYENHYSDTAFITRPIKMNTEGFKGSVRVVLRGILHSYWDFESRYARSVVDADIEYPANPIDTESVMRMTRMQFFRSDFNAKYGVSKVVGLYVYASNDCRRWSMIGCMERANIINRDLGCTVHHGGYKYIMVAFVGRLKDNSKIDYLEIQAEEKYNNKTR